MGRGLKKFKNFCARVKYAKIVAALDVDTVVFELFAIYIHLHFFYATFDMDWQKNMLINSSDLPTVVLDCI